MNGGGGIIGVAGPVDLTSLAHHEEALVVVQNLNTLFHIVGQGPQFVCPVQLIGHGIRVGQMLVDNDDRTGGDLIGLSLGLYHVVARLLCQGIQILLVLVRSGGLFQSASSKILKARVD